MHVNAWLELLSGNGASYDRYMTGCSVTLPNSALPLLKYSSHFRQSLGQLLGERFLDLALAGGGA